jgi:hypothetical protein
MKIYITKPIHSKYGSIKLENKYKNIDELVQDSCLWVRRPHFEKAFKCIFTDDLVIRGWYSDFGYIGTVNNFPNNEIKKIIIEKIKNSIENNFYESLKNRHYKWIGELDLKMIRKETFGNFNLYLTKPTSFSIQSRGIDKAEFWLQRPVLKESKEENRVIYSFSGESSISGKFFRKCFDEKFLEEAWDDIVNSFDFEHKDMDEFYFNLKEEYSKPGQDYLNFCKEYYFDLILGDSNENN